MNAPPFDLSGKTALVTGAAQGIGKGIALALARQGVDIVLVDLAEAQKTQGVADEIVAIGRKAWVIEHDLSDTESLGQLAQDAWQKAGKLDILVNNAGIAVLKHFHEIDVATWRKIMTVNVEAMFFLSQQVALKMIKTGIKGRIINLSSKNGLVAEAGLSVYNTSKGAVELLTQSLATELGVHGITVNALAPGVTLTDIGQDFSLETGFRDFVKAHVPLEHRYANVEEIAAGAVFLASPAASYMTGQHLVIDGGVLAQQMPRLQFMPPTKLE